MRRYCLFLIPHLLLSVLRYPLAVIAVLFFSTKTGRHLTRFEWLETIDNDLSGDSGWKEEHLIGPDPLSMINRIRWLWRNGGNTVNYGLLGVDDNPSWRVVYGCASGPRWERPDGAWLYRRYISLAGLRYVELFFGWALFGPQKGRCKIVCSIRLKKEVPVS